jgi:hypothetical protein
VKESFAHISEDKLERYQFLKEKYPNTKVSFHSPSHLSKYLFRLKLLGLPTILEQLILKEQKAQNFYEKYQHVFEEGNAFFRQNREHELLLKKIRETL